MSISHIDILNIKVSHSINRMDVLNTAVRPMKMQVMTTRHPLTNGRHQKHNGHLTQTNSNGNRWVTPGNPCQRNTSHHHPHGNQIRYAPQPIYSLKCRFIYCINIIIMILQDCTFNPWQGLFIPLNHFHSLWRTQP